MQRERKEKRKKDKRKKEKRNEQKERNEQRETFRRNFNIMQAPGQKEKEYKDVN